MVILACERTNNKFTLSLGYYYLTSFLKNGIIKLGCGSLAQLGER